LGKCYLWQTLSTDYAIKSRHCENIYHATDKELKCMFDNDENDGMGQVYLLGCPVGLALVLVALLLVLVVGGSILAFAFPSPTPTPNAEVSLPLESTTAATEGADDPALTQEAEVSTEAAEDTETEDAEEVTAEITVETTPES
jgi:hypothetical protein